MVILKLGSSEFDENENKETVIVEEKELSNYKYQRRVKVNAILF